MKCFHSVPVVALLLACSVTSRGALAADAYHPIDLQAKANLKLTDVLGGEQAENTLASLPTGMQSLGGVRFQVGPKLIHLGSRLVDRFPERVDGIAIDRKSAKLHLLHATCYGGGPNTEAGPGVIKDGTLIGVYMVYYDDKSAQAIPIVYGEDVRDWWYQEGQPGPSRAKVVWTGDNPPAASYQARLRLYVSTWVNPMPEKPIAKINYIAYKEDTAGAPFCIAITAED